MASSNVKLSPDCIPLPPEIIILADVNSGLSDSVNSSDMYSDSSGLGAALIISTLEASCSSAA